MSGSRGEMYISVRACPRDFPHGGPFMYGSHRQTYRSAPCRAAG